MSDTGGYRITNEVLFEQIDRLRVQVGDLATEVRLAKQAAVDAREERDQLRARVEKLETRLNGQVVQRTSTDDMLFDLVSLIATISEAITLEPGDVIMTGTPAGVGFARKPPLFMKPGDVCEVEIEGIGILRNPVIDEAG